MPDLRLPQPPVRVAWLARGLLSPLGVTLLGLAQLLDYVTFRAMIRVQGPGAELNPFALAVHDHGPLMALTAKVTVWALVAAIAAVLATDHPRVARFVVAFGIIAGLVGAFSNLVTL